MRRASVDIITLGCSKNLVDSEKLMSQFKANGLRVRHDPDKVSAETVIINTCGFIGDAQEESINMILECCELKKAGRVGRVYVMGCLSQKFHKELMAEIPEVDGWYGKFDWSELVKVTGHRWHQELENERMVTTPSHYAYLKIAEGCNRGCAYCAIPLMTGKYQSRSQEDILDEARKLVSKGVKEIQLIAQDLTYYGTDVWHKPTIAELVQRLSDIPGVEWLRLHYGYPNNFPMDLLPVMRERDNVCKYMDIALQHISDSVLKRILRAFVKRFPESICAQRLWLVFPVKPMMITISCLILCVSSVLSVWEHLRTVRWTEHIRPFITRTILPMKSSRPGFPDSCVSSRIYRPI